jgi:two-component system, chemotaxis family, sensor kinase CheA
MPRDLQSLFRLEAREIIDRLSDGMSRLSGVGIDDEAFREMLRLAHTLKGAARVAGHPQIASVVHTLEESLAEARHSEVARQRCITSVQTLEAMLADLELRASPGQAKASSADTGTPAPSQSLRVDLADLARLDRQLDNIRLELVGLRSRVREVDTVIADVDAAQATLDALRLVPMSFVADHLARSAADTAAALHKQVEVQIAGGDVRVELQVAEAVRDALIQAIRNAVVHGIEDPPVRMAAGKPATGAIRVAARSRGDVVVFTCEDDGRGIDMPVIRQLLVRNGSLTPAAERSASDAEVLEAMLSQRVSSTAIPSVHAGRGIGLDVVRETVSRVRGRIRLRTARGIGTTVEITVPAAISEMAMLRVSAPGQRALIPLTAVTRVTRIAPDDIERTESGATALVDASVVPYMPLGSTLRPDTAGWRVEPFAVVLRHGDQPFAIGTSDPGVVLSTFARRLPPLAAADPVVSAVADVHGEFLPILNVDRLVARRHARREPLPTPARQRTRVLVVDDSVTTRLLEQSILETAGYLVDTASSGEEALDRLSAGEYAAMVVDIEMPGMSGLDLLERMQASPSMSRIPAVLVTSRDSDADRRRGRAAGAREYFVKSAFDQEQLLATIGRLVG